MILVTGGSGLVGSHLLLNLIKTGEKVRATKRSSSDLSAIKRLFERNSLANRFSSIEWVDCEILDVLGLARAMDGITHVYHCAAIVSFSPKERKKMLTINIEGTANIVNICLEKSIKKLCYVSSTAAIGKKDKKGISTENTEWNKEGASQYAISKYRAEQEVWRGKEEGLAVVIVNPSIIIGANEWGKSSTSVITSVWKGLQFYTTGTNAFVDVKDVVAIMILLMNSTIVNERFLVISENWKFKLFFETIAKALNKPLPKIKAGKVILNLAWRFEKWRSLLFKTTPVITKETAKTSQTVQQFSNAKIKQALQYEFIPLKKSIETTCAIFLQEMK